MARAKSPVAAAPVGGGAPAAPGGGTDPAAGPGPAPQYVASSWLNSMRAMIAGQQQLADVQRREDQKRADFRAGLGLYRDPNNRFSDINLIERAFGRRVVGANTDFASLGALHSGAYQQELKDAEFDQGHGKYGVEQSHLDTTSQINRAAEAAKQQASMELLNAEQTDAESWKNAQLRSLAGA